MKYTLKQIADTAQVSKTTVRRHRDKIPESILNAGSCKEGNIIYYSEEIAERIFKSLEDAGAGTQAEQEATNSKSQLKTMYKEITAHTEALEHTETGEKLEIVDSEADKKAVELYKETNEAFKIAVETLTEQLNRKDAQITELTELLKKAEEKHKILNEQYREIMQQHQQIEEKKSRQSLFSRIFKRKAKTAP